MSFQEEEVKDAFSGIDQEFYSPRGRAGIKLSLAVLAFATHLNSNFLSECVRSMMMSRNFLGWERNNVGRGMGILF